MATSTVKKPTLKDIAAKLADDNSDILADDPGARVLFQVEFCVLVISILGDAAAEDGPVRMPG